MNKKEFLQRLKEDKWFDKPQELIDYRLPICQFYLNHYVNITSIINGKRINTKEVVIEYKPEDFTLVNQAYIGIKEKFDKALII